MSKYLLIAMLVCSTSARAVTILCLGDSLTEGLGVAKQEAWPAVAEGLLKSKKMDVTLTNAGISGSTTASGPSRINWYLKSKTNFDWMILALGANDGLRGLDVKLAQANLEKTIALAKAGGIKKIVIAGMKVLPNYGIDYAKSFESMFPLLSKSQKVDLLPFLLDGVAAKPELNQPDGIHPNAAGHKIIGANLAKFIESHL